MMPGMPERRSHDYVRHGTTSLFAAFNIADGTVIHSLHRRHRAGRPTTSGTPDASLVKGSCLAGMAPRGRVLRDD